MSRDPTFVALGDSTGVGIGASDGRGYVDRVAARLHAAHPAARVVNLCESGATSATARARQLPRVAQARPDVVTVFIGGNDLWRGVEPIAFGVNLEAIANALRPTGAAVLLGTVANLAHAPAARLAEQFAGIARTQIERRVGLFNVEVARVAAINGFGVIDLAGVGLADSPHYFCADGFHPSSSGYAAWAELLWPALEGAIRWRLGTP